MCHRVRRRYEMVVGVVWPLMEVAYSTEFERIVSRDDAKVSRQSVRDSQRSQNGAHSNSTQRLALTYPSIIGKDCQRR